MLSSLNELRLVLSQLSTFIATDPATLAQPINLLCATTMAVSSAMNINPPSLPHPLPSEWLLPEPFQDEPLHPLSWSLGTFDDIAYNTSPWPTSILKLALPRENRHACSRLQSGHLHIITTEISKTDHVSSCVSSAFKEADERDV
jgi:hypothetical protein